MKILHIVPSYLPAIRYGGPIRSVHGLCSALSKKGHDVTVLTTNKDGNGESRVPIGQPVDVDGVKVYYFRTRLLNRLYFSPGMQRMMETECRRSDVVHLHSVFLWPTLAGARISGKESVPYVLSPRGMLVGNLIEAKNKRLKKAWIKLFERKTMLEADAVHFTSRLEADEALKIIPGVKRYDIIPNGFDLKEDNPVSPGKQGSNGMEREFPAPFLLYLGRLCRTKGLDRLISVFSRLDSRMHLVMAGPDEDNLVASLSEAARAAGVRERITFAGSVDGVRKEFLLKNASMVLQFSPYESFGMSVLEAMAYGCPVGVTEGVGLAPEIDKTGAGVVLRGDTSRMADDLNRILASSERLSKMGAAGKKAAVEQFSWEAVAASMEGLYSSLAGRKRN